MKLYRSKKYPNRWYAQSPATGWVTFSCMPDGWSKREPARGIDPIDIREVPVHLAFDCGIPGAPNVGLGDAA
jgi:hypothetical protein